jgi:hypothetical protein
MGKGFRYQYEDGAAMEMDSSGSRFLNTAKKAR